MNLSTFLYLFVHCKYTYYYILTINLSANQSSFLIKKISNLQTIKKRDASFDKTYLKIIPQIFDNQYQTNLRILFLALIISKS